jgi:hypothetical protein
MHKTLLILGIIFMATLLLLAACESEPTPAPSPSKITAPSKIPKTPKLPETPELPEPSKLPTPPKITPPKLPEPSKLPTPSKITPPKLPEPPKLPTPPTTPAPTLVTETIEDTDSSFVWEGDWESQENAGASGGTWTVAPPSGQAATYDAKANITFTGTEVALVYVTAPHGGRVSVNIDGVDYPDIDMYSADVKVKVKETIATDLDNTEHVLELVQLNERNSLSTGYVIAIDAIQVTRPE